MYCCYTDPRDELSFPTFNLFSMDAVHLAQQLTDLAAVSSSQYTLIEQSHIYIPCAGETLMLLC